MTPDQLTKLKDGDIIRNTTGNAYTVLRNIGLVVIATRTIEITNAAEWEHVYTTTSVKEADFNAAAAVRAATELKRLGWTRVSDNRWTSPGGCVHTMLSAWKHRHDFKPSPEPRPFVTDMLHALKLNGWRYDGWKGYWIAPDGAKFYTLREAFANRSNHKAPASLTVKSPAPSPSPLDRLKDLNDAGWTRVSYSKWKDPAGEIFTGPDGAWSIMHGRKVNACLARPKTAPYRCPTVEETVEELQKLKSKVKSFDEAREALRKAGWVNVAGRVWRAPSGCFVDGTRCAYDSMSAGFHKSEGDCNAS